MFYIKNAGAAKSAMSSEIHLQFVKKCEVYISRLKSGGNLVAAQPIMKEGVVVAKTDSTWNVNQLDVSLDVHVGYYHIMAENIEQAIELAKANPEFEYVSSAKIEIHQIKTKEEETEFVYPKGADH